MDRLEDDYWTSSTTRGFNFDSEDLPKDGVSGIFGVSQAQTTELSKKIKDTIPEKPTKNPPLQHSTSLLSLSSTSSGTSVSRSGSAFRATHKFLSSTVHIESVLGPKDAIRSLLLDMAVDLSPFRKLSDKTLLLDEALKVGDGDIVSKVLLFLQKTLNQPSLFSVLSKRPAAALQYLSILEKQRCYEEAAILCIEIGQPREAFVILYNKSMKSELLVSSLQSLSKNVILNVKGIEYEKQMLKEHTLLLERQIVIASDGSKKLENNKEFSFSPQIGKPVTPNNLVGSSLFATLQYCSRCYWDSPENLIASPHGLRKSFSINERQFIWNAFIGRLLSGHDPTPTVLVKGLLGAPKIAGGLSVTRLLDVASKLGCQPNVLDQLLPLVDSSQKRFKLAVQYKRHRFAIDVLTSSKDRIGLLQYRDSLKEGSEIEYINNILRVSSTRWKN